MRERERAAFVFPPLQTKKQYEKASEEAENAMHTLEKADNDPNSTKAKIDKVINYSIVTYQSCDNNRQCHMMLCHCYTLYMYVPY